MTTDPPHVAAAGTLAGGEVLTAVDFGPGWFDPAAAYAVQKSLNAPGLSPPLCSEFYTGWVLRKGLAFLGCPMLAELVVRLRLDKISTAFRWLSHWGEAMANTSAPLLANDTAVLLRWGGGAGGSLNFYMAHGGTNFGWTAGANLDPALGYQPHITSYDYHAPISEAGDYCQPGIGGECKFWESRRRAAPRS